jgi:hypothetical protein
VSELLNRNVLVISQKPKFVEMTNEYEITDESGAHLGAIRQEGQSKARKLLRLVMNGDGAGLGKIVQENIVGKKRFRLAGPADETLGSIDAENWRSWDFAIRDASGSEVGRITKKWAGILREGFTTADRYLLNISGEVSAGLRGLMVASAAGIDTALKQDDTGGFGFGGLDLDV